MFQWKLLKKNSGISLVEVIVALTVLGILSVPISMAYINTMKLTRLSDSQIQLNSITRIVSQNVSGAIKGGDIHGNTGVELTDGTDYFGDATNPRENLRVFDHNGKEYVNYQFDAVYRGIVDGREKLRAYTVILKKLNPATGSYDEVRRFVVEANTLPE